MTTNVAARSRLVYDWINAYALAGNYVPVNATQTVLRIGGYGQPQPQEVDELIAELTLGDEQPGGHRPARPATAGPIHRRQPGHVFPDLHRRRSGRTPVADFWLQNHFQRQQRRVPG